MTRTKIIVTTPQGILLKFIRSEWTWNDGFKADANEFYIKNGFLYLTDDKGTSKGFPIAWCELTGVQ